MLVLHGVLAPLYMYVNNLLVTSPNILYAQGEVTSPTMWSRYDRHFVGITCADFTAKICRAIHMNQISLSKYL